MQGAGVEVGAVGPGDRAEFGIYVDLSEDGGVAELLEHWPPQVVGEVDLTHDAVIEGET